MTTVETLSDAHATTVETLQSSYAAIPPGHTVRLAKRTSNLFRPRAGQPLAGLDVSGLADVIFVDPQAQIADVQGMCTYERLLEATLPHGLMPLVVPQLKTITIGGAITGLGIESSSFRNGLPHESVVEMDILAGNGSVVTATPDGPHSDLFRAFPNSYGSLGYATRVRVELEPVSPYVALHHVRFTNLDRLTLAIASISSTGGWEGEAVDFVDGVVFSADESYLTLGRWIDDISASGLLTPSDYSGQQIYYRSLRERTRDVLTVHDYLWRWDTDWFWCSHAFGAQRPTVRRLWPAKWRRSDVYHRIVGVENRYQVIARIDKARGRPAQERVVQDVEIPVEQTADFLRWFADRVGMTPVWLCPISLRSTARSLLSLAADSGTAADPASADDHAKAGADKPWSFDKPWPLYPLHSGQVYVNVGFWGQVDIQPDRVDGDVNRAIEAAVQERGGHKSLYSDAYYDADTFWSLYGGTAYARVKATYDPDKRLTGLYEKAVARR